MRRIDVPLCGEKYTHLAEFYQYRQIFGSGSNAVMSLVNGNAGPVT